MHIIMNPPYSGSLHLKILREAMKHSDDIVCLHPNNFRKYIHEYMNKAPFSKEACEHLESAEVIEHSQMNRMFGTGNAIDEGLIGRYTTNGKHLPLPFSDIVIAIEEKINKKTKQPASGFNKPGDPWTRVKRDKLVEPYVLLDVWAGTIASESSNAHYGIQFKTEEEKTNYLDCYNNSWLSKWRLKVNGKPGISYIISGYSHPWTDDMLYKYFNLNEEEIKEIESIV